MATACALCVACPDTTQREPRPTNAVEYWGGAGWTGGVCKTETDNPGNGPPEHVGDANNPGPPW
eukprot:4470430-Lingulodinium_polyedra.AAC.1